MTLSNETIELIEKKALEYSLYDPAASLSVYIDAAKSVLADPEILASVKGEEWVRVEDGLPEKKCHVLIKYYKHKKGNWTGNTGIFITQGYYTEVDHCNFSGELLYTEKSWYDYTDRLIWNTTSASKNKVIEWQPLRTPSKTK